MKVLWIGDIAVATGFARLSHAVTLELHEQGHEVVVIGINYAGDPHDYPFRIYPAKRFNRREDGFGVQRYAELVVQEKPDVVVVINDHWNLEPYQRATPKEVPLVGVFCIDGKNVPGKILNGLRLAIFNTEFGLNEAVCGGYTGPAEVIPYGVTDIYTPGPRQAARHECGFPSNVLNKFIVGTVARNAPRKRLDLTVRYFAKWIQKYSIEDAYLFVHALGSGGQGWDIAQLGSFYGISGSSDNPRLLMMPPTDMAHGVEELDLRNIYRALDVYINTAQGEGWGFPIMEAMACNIPCIVPDWSALGEWAAPAASLVPCTSFAHTTGGINVMGGIPDEFLFIEALDQLYESRGFRKDLGRMGYDLVNEDRYRWNNIAERYCEALTVAVKA